MARFRVDTHLFRELGELLVGRDSTALIELVKNSYDADATEVTVVGSQLGSSGRGVIEISDNGVGMTAADFERGFLTIAGRTKDTPTRRSALYRRKYTGAKGIGRLAAHKLSHLVRVRSIARTSSRFGDTEIEAQIDWDALEQHELLEDAGAAVSIKPRRLSSPRKHGTTLTLEPVRRRWTERQLVTFLAEVQSFEPPPLVAGPLSPGLPAATLLFEQPRVRDVGRRDPGFVVHLEGDFDLGEPLWQAVETSISWILDIDAQADGVTYRVVPTRRTVERTPEARAQSVLAQHPHPREGPFFQARILIREGEQPGSSAVKSWAAAASGVRVFMEGFRVLPYGERSDDWLDIAAESTRRSDKLPGLDTAAGIRFLEDSLPPEQEHEGLSALASTHYFGAVLLTEEGAPALRMLVNREGFVPDESFESLRTLVRTGIHLSIRARASASQERRHRRRVERRGSTRAGAVDMTPVVAEAADLARRTREHLAHGRIAEASETSEQMLNAMRRVRSEIAVIQDEQSLLRVVASIGTQMSSFVHELNGLVGGAKATEAALHNLRSGDDLSRSARRAIGEAERALNSLRQGLERQASFLTDVVSADARRRRSRQVVYDRFQAASRLVSRAAERRSITIANRIPPDLRTRPMFPAELTAIFSNLLTNAVKAAGEGGRVTAFGEESNDGVRIRVENTGVRVELEDSERWFRPFESTTADVDASLGQGMGLGLPITRLMLEQYGGTIRFVSPRRAYESAIEIFIPSK